MAGVWKRDGTVAVTNGNKKVTGTGTTFADTKNGVAKGHLFCITSGTSVDFYEVDYAVSNTELYLVQAYRGVTATGKAYEIITTFSDSVPEFARRLTATLSAYQQQSDAFQALLTSNAATIEVPAPDGTKQTLIPWKRVTSDGEGQAARAKVEADKATAAANLAVNVVRDAALPLPDVWAPLSDSLRLITGYGRDVLIGADVVARFMTMERLSKASYFDKSGVWRIANNDEPRFETKGLLIEGQSSNCVQYADKPGSWTLTDAKFTRTALAADGQSQAPTGVCVINTASASPRITGSNNLLKTLAVGDALTASCRFKLTDTSCNFRFRFANQNGFQGSVLVGGDGVVSGVDTGITCKTKVLGDGYIAAEATLICKEAGPHYCEFQLLGKAGADIAVGVEVRVQLPQVEMLASRSSFIPSDAAEATRATEFPSLLRLGNDNYFGPITIAAEISCNGPGVVGAGNSARRGIFSGVPTTGATEILMLEPPYWRPAWQYPSGISATGPELPACNDGLSHVIVAQCDGAFSRVYGDSIKGSTEISVTPVYGADPGTIKDRILIGLGANSTTARHLWGHIRNLRVWHRALSDAQCKAIRG